MSTKIKSFLLLTLFLTSMNLFASNGELKNDSRVFENFSLYDYNTKIYSLNDFNSKEGIVIIFISTQCPVSNAYNSRMNELFDKNKDKFSIIGINSNKQEDMQKIKEHAAYNKFEFVILKDSNNVIADKFNASFTPEVFVLSNKYELLYHGRIDDSRRFEDVSVNDLQNSLNEIAAGKEVSVKETKAFGCSIKRVDK